MSSLRTPVALLACLLLLGLAACNDDDGPTCPDGAPAPTLANIWPHADGNAWTFDVDFSEYEEALPGQAVADTTNPELPSMEALHADLQQAPPGEPVGSFAGIYRLALDGEMVTESGVTAQRVRETFFLDMPTKTPGRALIVQETPDRLLRLIARARPDLRDAILPHLDGDAKALVAITPPFFVGGYAFACEDSGYYGYGDLDTNHSWVYLEKSLSVGHEFSLQLVPLIANDIWLYGRIWSRGDLVVNGQQFRNVVECMYVVDMGIQEGIDENGDPSGTFHSYMYGTTHFAPEVGPVMGLERQRLAPDSILQEGVPSIRDYVLNLVGGTQAD